MPASQINAAAQIRAATITLALLAPTFSLPTAQLAEGALFLKKDGSVPLTANLNFGGFTGTSVPTPTAADQIANKGYVDSTTQGLDPKPGVRAVAVANVASLSGAATIDGVALTVGVDRLLLTAQTAGAQNGIWVVQTGAWTRPSDYAAGSSTVVTDGAYVMVEQGTAYKGTGWIIASQGAITVDTTATTWQQFQGATTITAGNGVSVTGNVVAVKNGNGLVFDGSTNLTLNLTGASLNLSAAGLKIADAGSPGQVMLGGTSNAATFTTLSGDVLSVGSSGVVTLATAVRRSTSFVINELPGGAVNGTNTIFTLASTPVVGTVEVFLNGQKLFPGSGNDYTVASGTVTLLTAPVTGDRVVTNYQV
jgi:hypothetical protein